MQIRYLVMSQHHFTYLRKKSSDPDPTERQKTRIRNTGIFPSYAGSELLEGGFNEVHLYCLPSAKYLEESKGIILMKTSQNLCFSLSISNIPPFILSSCFSILSYLLPVISLNFLTVFSSFPLFSPVLSLPLFHFSLLSRSQKFLHLSLSLPIFPCFFPLFSANWSKSM